MNIYTDLDKNKSFNQVVFSSDFKNITYADEIITKISENIHINHDIFGKILLSLSEAINNAIVHGNKFDIVKSVIVTYGLQNSKLVIFVKDEGDGFDYNLVDDPTDIENIEKLSGRGVFIILNLADEVKFFYSGGQIVKMIFDL